tara:strand:- start:1347 stop:2543 length:1197 start_codon:yes stop_codon:yes gene_type:complete
MICKITKKKISSIINFGKMPLANGFLKKNQFKEEFFYSMEAGFNKELSLFQINDHPKPKKIFNSNYPFFTGSSKFMIKHFKNYSNFIKKRLGKHKNIIEIGSNDGTFLSNFSKKKYNCLGFEPSKNVCDIAKKRGIKSINNFFNLQNVKKQKKFINNTNIICASNVICHIPNLVDLIKSVHLLLEKNGKFIFEEPYLGSMYEKVSYDQIYDEHIFMFSASSVKKTFKLFGLYLNDAIPQITHGGSMRYVVSKKDFMSKRLNQILKNEKKYKIDKIDAALKFKKKCKYSRDLLRKKIFDLKKKGKKICGYGATSKSTTILNYCNINHKHIDFICDTTPEKQNKFSPGAHIPIKTMDYFYKNIPSHIYLFAWNHKKEIFKKEKKIMKKVKWFSHVILKNN